MAKKKCKKGMKMVGNACVSKIEHKLFGKFADEFIFVKGIIFGSLVSVGGWALFKGITRLLNLENLNSWILIFGGITIMIIAYKFGLAKISK